MSGIFISYRREDSAPYARLLSESLGSHFGADEIFRDIDTIGPGVDFPEAIAKAVGGCQVLLAVIGGKWLDAEQGGQRRLDNEGDYVRLEIAAALQRNILVVPVLLEQTRMPSKAELPADLAELADRNAVRLTDDGWNDAVRRLATRLERTLGVGTAPATAPVTAAPQPRPQPSTPGWGPPAAPAPTPPLQPTTGGGGKKTGVIAGVVVAVLVIAAIGVAVLAGGGDDDDQVVTQEPTTSVATVTTRPPVRVTTTLPVLQIATKITLTPTSGRAGTSVTVSGTGFAANEQVNVEFNGERVARADADSRGAFTVKFTVPDLVSRLTKVSEVDVVATGTSRRTAKAPFEFV